MKQNKKAFRRTRVIQATAHVKDPRAVGYRRGVGDSGRTAWHRSGCDCSCIQEVR